MRTPNEKLERRSDFGSSCDSANQTIWQCQKNADCTNHEQHVLLAAISGIDDSTCPTSAGALSAACNVNGVGVLCSNGTQTLYADDADCPLDAGTPHCARLFAKFNGSPTARELFGIYVP